MKIIAEIVANKREFGRCIFHVKLVPGRRRFFNERIVASHIGPRPWSEAFWVDEKGCVHEVFSGSGPVRA